MEFLVIEFEFGFFLNKYSLVVKFIEHFLLFELEFELLAKIWVDSSLSQV